MVQKEKSNNVEFAKILSDGLFHIECEPDTPGAIKREVEKTDGTKKVYIEETFSKLTGKITSLEIKDGDWGRVLYIGLDNEVVITVGTSNDFGKSLMKKIPNIDVTKEVTFAPYAFIDDRGKTAKGVTVYQDGEKLNSYFQEGTGKDAKMLHGFPSVNQDKIPPATNKTEWREFWADYGKSVEKFLVDYIQKNHTIEYVEQTPSAEEDTSADDVAF